MSSCTDWKTGLLPADSPVSGILNVDKPAGPTSFDIVRLVRRGTGERRVGHGGTLDPMASGVLVIMLGQATRVSEYLLEQPKAYRAQIRLGIATTTYDAEGEVTSRSDVNVTHAQFNEALGTLLGETLQVPPAHSALKVGGRRAYTIARQGLDPALPARPVHIYAAEVVEFDPPHAVVIVECGRGTYIRSLAHDLGEILGCGAHLSALVRTRVGPFWIERAIEGGRLERALNDGSWPDLVDPVDMGLLSLPQLTLSIEDEKDVRHGQAVTLSQAATPDDGTAARAYAEDGSFIGVLRYDISDAHWHPRKIFAPAPGRIAS